jgi:hypothetical protein
MILHILLITGLILYITNYATGWLLYYKKISMTKKTHQILFALIIINLISLLFFLKLFEHDFNHCSASLIMMIILPIGKKGGKYHITVSTLGLLFYFIFILNLFFINLSKLHN